MISHEPICKSAFLSDVLQLLQWRLVWLSILLGTLFKLLVFVLVMELELATEESDSEASGTEETDSEPSLSSSSSENE